MKFLNSQYVDMCCSLSPARFRIVNQQRFESRVFAMVDDVYLRALYYLYVSYTLMLFKSTDGESTVRNVFK